MPNITSKILIAAAALTMSLGACAQTSTPSSEPAVSETAIMASAEDFRPLEGGPWTGTLNYQNYSSDKRSTIDTGLSVDVKSDRKVAYVISYPNEPWENTKSSFKISKDGTKIDGAIVIERAISDTGAQRLVTQTKGQDDNRAADIRITYEISATEFSMTKDVRFEGEETYINRNIYNFTR